jgi:tetraacyldisaccharide 4'-kinase
MREALQRAWLHRGLLACALWPLSLAYGALVRVRNAAFRAALFTVERVRVPVVVVGNVVAGGTGKTPIVQALVRHLQRQGLAVGVVSRGYGRRTRGCREVLAGSDAADVGDEPLLTARACAVPVFVAERRVEAARALLVAYPATQVIVSDDGLQHRALARDIEICVFDERGSGNGWLLPAGPLREPWPRQVDFVLGPGAYSVTRSLATEAMRADGTRVPVEALRGRPLTAVAGIGEPQRFFEQLRRAGLQLAGTIALPDHHPFDAPLDAPGEIVCTEKDAVKLWRTRPDALAVPLRIEIEPAFWRAFDALLLTKLSSPREEHDGPQTA